MRDPTPQEIAHYRDSGFVALPDFLAPDELTEWREAVGEAVAARAAPVAAGDRGGRMAARADTMHFFYTVFNQEDHGGNLWSRSERMRRLVCDPELGRIAAALAGVEGIRLWQDQALIKQPYANPTSFHPDVPYWSFDSPDALSAWIALEDATMQNGCMGYIPGSHRTLRYEKPPISPVEPNPGATFEFYPEWRDVEAVFCPVPAGAVIFHNGLTLHGAGANMTPGYRRAMTCAYMPDGAAFNGKEYGMYDFSRFRAGDPLNDDDMHPLVWSRGR